MEFSRELLVDEVLGETFHLHRTKFMLVVLPMIAAGVLAAFLSLLVDWYMPWPAIPAAATSIGGTVNRVFFFGLNMVGKAFLVFTIYWTTSIVAQGVLVKYCSDFFKDEKANFAASLGFTIKKLPHIIGIGLVTSVAVYFGLFFLIVPGILLAIMLLLTLPVFIVEEKSIFESMKRSVKLVSNRWVKTFGLLFAVYMLILIVAVPVSLVAGFLLPQAFVSLISNVIVALVQPIVPVAATLWYFSMTAKEQTVKT